MKINNFNILYILYTLIFIFIILKVILLIISFSYLDKKQNIELNSYNKYLTKKDNASKFIKFNKHPFTIRSNESNRYNDTYYNTKKAKKTLIFSKFNKILNVDLNNMTIDVESYVKMIDIFNYLFSIDDKNKYTLRMSTETMDMTVGGAISGIGVHGNIHHVGFFHESVVDMDILLSNGDIITCSKNNNSELFHSIPNTYGTIGKILRARLKIVKAKSYVKTTVIKFNSLNQFIKKMKLMSDMKQYDFIFSLVYNKNELYLILFQYVNNYDNLITFTEYLTFYKYIKTHSTFYMTTKESMFIFESDWYWNIPDNKILKFLLPTNLRRMKFFKKVNNIDLGFNKDMKKKSNILIQDWEIEYEKSFTFLKHMLDNIEPYMNNKPLCIFPLISNSDSYFYPIKKNKLYLNIGSYSILNNNKYNFTKMFDSELYKYNGIKMLYSVHYFSKKQFNHIYNGIFYKKIKEKYDKEYKFGDLYLKTKNY